MLTWDLTVDGLTSSLPAIGALFRPSAIEAGTTRSRSVRSGPGFGGRPAARTMTRATSGVWWLLNSAVRTASGGVRSVEAIPTVCLPPLEPPAADPKEGAQLGEGEDDAVERVREADLLIPGDIALPGTGSLPRPILAESATRQPGRYPARGPANRRTTLTRTVL